MANWVQKADLDPQDFLTAGPAAAGSIKINPASPTLAGLGGGGAVTSVEGQTGNVDLKTVGGISLVGPGDIPFPADAVLSVEGQTGNVDLKTVGGTSLVGPGDNDNITVTYLAATPGGANNVLLNWRALGGAAI